MTKEFIEKIADNYEGFTSEAFNSEGEPYIVVEKEGYNYSITKKDKNKYEFEIQKDNFGWVRLSKETYSEREIMILMLLLEV